MQKPLLPIPPDLPKFSEAISSLEDVPKTLYHGLEQAAFKASQFAERDFNGKKLDAGLIASVLRAHTIDYLRDAGLDAREDGCHWTFNNIPFLGISFFYKQKYIRVLKGRDGQLPGCGKSREKRRFYSQIKKRYLVNEVPHETTENYVVLWDIDTNYALKQLWLALPARGAARSQDVLVYWCEEIPHPVEAAAPQPPTTTPSAPNVPDELDNLIQRKDEEDEEQQEQPNVR